MKPSKFCSKFNLRDRIPLKKFKEFEKRYETFTEIPLISNGWIANNSNNTSMIDAVHVVKTQKNNRQKTSRTLLESYVNVNNKYKQIPWIWNVNTSLIFPSPSRNKIAIINNIIIDKNKNDNKKQSVIEIYDNNQLTETIYPPKNTFGDIYKSAQFSGVTWSFDEKLIAFVAETDFEKKSTNFFDDKTLIKKYDNNDDKVNKDDDDKLFGQSYEFKETFGEQMKGATTTSLFIFNFNLKKLYYFNNNILPNNVSLGECIFDPNDNTSLIVVSHSIKPRRLGVRFYNTRPTKLWLIKLSDCVINDIDDNNMINATSVVDLLPDEHSPSNIRFSPDGKLLIYLTTNNTYAHLSATKLQSIVWPPVDVNNIVIETIIDIPIKIKSSDVILDNKFGGLFTVSSAPLPDRCWISNELLLINSLFCNKYGVLLVDVNSKVFRRFDELNEIKKHFENEINNEISRDMFILDIDIKNQNILFKISSIYRGHSVHVYDYKNKIVHDLTKTINYDHDDIINNLLIKSIPNISTKIYNVKCNDTDNKDNDNEIYSSILYIPPPDVTEFDNNPTILLYVHGGPHSASTLTFNPQLLVLIYSGFAVLQVNYRGSIGISSSFVECLSGNIGDMDVRDCVNAFNFVCQSDNNLNISNCKQLNKILMGGSHGGFLTGHIISKYPQMFQCASSRNPVLNLYSMYTLTDIPDWVLYECGIINKYTDNINNIPLTLNINNINDINMKSPIYYINNVETPYQILCGIKDKRVPMQQAIDYYKILKSKNGNQNTRLLIYPDCQHSLNDVIEQEFDAWGNVWAWFYYHITTATTTNDDNNNSITNKIDNIIQEISQCID